MTRQLTNERQIRWLEAIKMFHFTIEHIEGKDNILADLISPVYEGINTDDVKHEDYLDEDNTIRNIDINTDGISALEQKPNTTASTANTNTGNKDTEQIPQLADQEICSPKPIRSLKITFLQNNPRRQQTTHIPTLHREGANVMEQACKDVGIT